MTHLCFTPLIITSAPPPTHHAQEGLETTAMAAAPVLFGWILAFYVLPKQFREFTRKGLNTHPEAWEKALRDAQSRLGQKGPDQQRQQRQ